MNASRELIALRVYHGVMLFDQLLAVIIPILLCAGVGYGWARLGLEYPEGFVTRAVMNIGAPCLIVSSFNGSSVDVSRLAGVSLATLVVMLLMGLAGLGLIRLLRLRVATFLPPLLFPNTGNMGLPLCLFAFGEEGLALGLAVFLVNFTLNMSLGLAIASGQARPAWLLRQPVLWAALVAVVLATGRVSLPDWAANTAGLLGGFTIPLMLLTLGVSLSRLRVAEWRQGLLFSAVRVLGGFGLGLLVAWLMGVEGTARGVLILQSAMPVAVFNYLLAARYGKEPGEVAGMVVLSTLLSIAALPAIVTYVLI